MRVIEGRAAAMSFFISNSMSTTNPRLVRSAASSCTGAACKNTTMANDVETLVARCWWQLCQQAARHQHAAAIATEANKYISWLPPWQASWLIRRRRPACFQLGAFSLQCCSVDCCCLSQKNKQMENRQMQNQSNVRCQHAIRRTQKQLPNVRHLMSADCNCDTIYRRRWHKAGRSDRLWKQLLQRSTSLSDVKIRV